MKKYLFLASILFWGSSLFSQTINSTTNNDKQKKSSESNAKPLSEVSKNQTVNTTRNQPKKIKTSPNKEIKIEKKKEDEK